MYYVLECYGPEDEDRRYIDKVPLIEGVNWNLGSILNAEIPNPIEIILDSEGNGVMMPMFKRTVLLFRDDILKVLAEVAGVDNLITYPANLLDPTTGQKFTNYKAINILGVIACADMDKSEWQAPSGSPIIDVDFDSLVIDESKAHNFLMFRLAECVSAIIVHESVKIALENHGIKHLDFVNPEDWIG